jgi:hypothetical protein
VAMTCTASWRECVLPYLSPIMKLSAAAAGSVDEDMAKDQHHPDHICTTHRHLSLGSVKDCDVEDEGDGQHAACVMWSSAWPLEDMATAEVTRGRRCST